MLRSLESFWDGFGAMRSTRQQRCKGRFRRLSAHWKNASIMGHTLDLFASQSEALVRSYIGERVRFSLFHVAQVIHFGISTGRVAI